MNVLEKILEETRNTIHMYEGFFLGSALWGYITCVEEVERIIRSHIEDLPNADAEEKSILCTVGKNGMLIPYDDTYDVTIHCLNKEDQEQTVKLIEDSNWIAVSEQLPKVPEGTEDFYCPEFNVTIKGADKATTLKFAPDGTWFDDSGEVYSVIAWKPLPEPYQPAEE